MQLMANKDNKQTNKYIFMISATLALGIFMSSPVFTNDEEIQVASLKNNLMDVTYVKDDSYDEEIGSIEIYKHDERLGAFSREDGSMNGSYGDGEYDE